jgi:prefoldin subunit 5
MLLGVIIVSAIVFGVLVVYMINGAIAYMQNQLDEIKEEQVAHGGDIQELRHSMTLELENIRKTIKKTTVTELSPQEEEHYREFINSKN